MVERLNRRRVLQVLAGWPLAGGICPGTSAHGAAAQPPPRVRPGDPDWPSDEKWSQLSREVGGRLIKVHSPLAACVGASDGATCAQIFKELKNPYFSATSRADPDAGLGRRLDVAAERLRGRRQIDAPMSSPPLISRGAQSAPRGERRRPQLPGHLQRAQLAADLDAADERDRAARRLRRRRLRGDDAPAGGVDRRGRHLATGL